MSHEETQSPSPWQGATWAATLRFLRSRLALRMMLIFLAAGLVPLLIFGLLAYVQVLEELEDQVELRLRQETKGVAMSVVERLLHLDASLAMLSAHGDPTELPRGLRHLFPGRFESLAVRSASGESSSLLGSPRPFELSAEDLEHLQLDRALMRIEERPDGEISVILARWVSEGGFLVWGEVDGTYLWDLGPQSSLPPRVELVVVGGEGRFLVRSEKIPPSLASRLRESSAERSSMPIRWAWKSEAYIGHFWMIPMQINYRTGPWVVALGAERSITRESLGRWRATFPLTLLLTVWIVLLLVLVQVRRSLDPLSRLQVATGKMAERDFSARVELETGDEFEDLGAAFNLMAAELGRQFETLSTVTLLGRAAISGTEDRTLLRSLLERLEGQLGFGAAAVMLEDGEGYYLGRIGLGKSGGASVDRRSGNYRKCLAREVGGAAWLLPERPWRPDVEMTVEIEGEELGVLAVAGGPAKAVRVLPELIEHLALVWRHRKLAKELDQERRGLEELVEQLPHGLVLLDAERRVLLANRLARDYLRDLSDASPGDRLTRLGSLELEIPAALEFVRWQELEMPEPFRRTFVVAQGPMGPSRSVVLLRDVTQEREMQIQLGQRDRLAAVGQLAAGMAHDLNNTLQVILSTSELILREPDPEVVNHHAERVLEQSRRGSALIRQVLDFSRRSIPSPRALSVNRLLEESSVLLQRLLPDSVELRAHTHSEELVVEADPTQLQQVVTNLVLNARDAVGEEGWIEIELGLDESLPEGILPRDSVVEPAEGWVVLAVSDSGPGIPDDLRSHIFEPFFTTKDFGHGTGLGLAQVHGIVESHDGALMIETGEGHGTCFRVFLPRSLESVEEVASEPDEDPGGDQHILVVEDHEIVRVIVTANLESLGYEVSTAVNGLEALAFLRARDPGAIDLVVSDINMPEMDGKRLARLLAEERPRLPILLLSGYAEEDAAALSSLPGVVGLLQKPVSMSELSKAVLGALARPGAD